MNAVISLTLSNPLAVYNVIRNLPHDRGASTQKSDQQGTLDDLHGACSAKLLMSPCLHRISHNNKNPSATADIGSTRAHKERGGSYLGIRTGGAFLAEGSFNAEVGSNTSAVK